MKCTSCGRGTVYFGDTCSHCGTRNHDNTQALDGFWGRFRPKDTGKKPQGPKKSFFSPAWAIPFKLLWLPIRLGWWLVKVPF
jgi:hypothetical protein